MVLKILDRNFFRTEAARISKAGISGTGLITKDNSISVYNLPKKVYTDKGISKIPYSSHHDETMQYLAKHISLDYNIDVRDSVYIKYYNGGSLKTIVIYAPEYVNEFQHKELCKVIDLQSEVRRYLATDVSIGIFRYNNKDNEYYIHKGSIDDLLKHKTLRKLKRVSSFIIKN